ncbi:LytR/AlgR family response regulator transcription factor [Idiomarina sp. OT37-5b]|uniref:LytR/AlgR family response regulator transcription factor n=1 Tax=Idiomarina sp. OT37-5b TaxID=2100422 RepID=UPI001319B958|nr:LytTR family DNA-binding domain-containing protein [Idiomarina sp. OT37-5b]
MKRVFPVRSVGKIELVPLEEIRWIKGAANYAEIHAQNGKYMHRETLHNLTQQLDPSMFLRIHRSAIVNLNHIKEISSELGRFSLVTLRDGTELKIGNGYRDTLFSALNL